MARPVLDIYLACMALKKGFASLLVIICLCFIAPGWPIRVLLDTDAAADVDDVGAISLLHALEDNGELERLIGVTFVGSNVYGAPAVAALNTYYGRDIPVGTLKEDGFLLNTTKYNRFLAENYPNPFIGADARQVPDAVQVARQVLAAQEDHSVHIVAIGPLKNLHHLLRSRPDDISSLTGWELISRKVVLLSCMGGAYPSGQEWNFMQDPVAAEDVTNLWPSPIFFTGYEIGIAVQTGSRLTETPEGDPERAAYELYLDGAGKSRFSWDQIAAIYAVRGVGFYFETSPPGWVSVNSTDGSNQWKPDAQGRHRYLKFVEGGASAVATDIEELMVKAGTSRAAATESMRKKLLRRPNTRA